MLPPYPKKHLSFQDQLTLLKSRGMVVDDDTKALRHLERIGYYRLKSYWFPFRQSKTATGANGKSTMIFLEDFRPGTNFRHGVDLYVFDKRLRLLMLDAIERVEVALRVDVAHTIGRRGAWAHHDPIQLDPKRAIKPIGQSTKHHDWLARANEAERRSKADWVGEFKRLYSPPLPIWMAVELWDFGALSHLLEIAHPVDRAAIAAKYGISNPDMLVSWIKTLAYVRNICAHHSRLWNQPLVIQPMLPKGSVPRLTHIGAHVLSQTRVYAAAAIAQHFLDVINPTSSWKVRLRALWTSFPTLPRIAPQQAGFLRNWGAAALWQ